MIGTLRFMAFLGRYSPEVADNNVSALESQTKGKLKQLIVEVQDVKKRLSGILIK